MPFCPERLQSNCLKRKGQLQKTFKPKKGSLRTETKRIAPMLTPSPLARSSAASPARSVAGRLAQAERKDPPDHPTKVGVLEINIWESTLMIPIPLGKTRAKARGLSGKMRSAGYHPHCQAHMTHPQNPTTTNIEAN